MNRRHFVVSGAGFGLGFSATSIFAQTPQSNDPIQSKSRASGPAPDPWPGTKKLLFVADVQTGYHHDAINHTMGVVEEMGRKASAFVTFLRTDSQLITKKPIVPRGKYAPSQNINTKTLDYFDAVFLLPAGNGTMNDEQKNALLSFVHDDGKGLIVGHAAGVAFTDKGGVSVWPEWNNLIGAQMQGEFHANCRVIVEDPKFRARCRGVRPASCSKSSTRISVGHTRETSTTSSCAWIHRRRRTGTVSSTPMVTFRSPLRGNTAKVVSSTSAGANSKRPGTIRV